MNGWMNEKRWFVAAFAFIVLVLWFAFTDPLSMNQSARAQAKVMEASVGRYQMAVAERSASYVLLLDTATGEVWGITFEPGTWSKETRWRRLPEFKRP